MKNEIFDNMLSRYELATEQQKRNAIFEVNQQIILAGLYAGGFFESAEDQRATCENTARAMGDAELFIKQRHIRNCHRADPTYGEGVAKALGLSLSEALTAADPAHPKWDWR